MEYIKPELEQKIIDFCRGNRKLSVLTGAGISADSGIPTFRDTDGFWTVGSVNYTPEEMGTFEMFRNEPLEVWKWFLYRATICNDAQPNISHYIIKDFEDLFHDRFRLISQNVDGLHRRAGNSDERTFNIHGNLEHARCSADCSKELYPFPKISIGKDDEFTDQQIDAIICPKCGQCLRPHVLWFDEYYNEKFYKSSSALRVSKETGLLLIIGTSGSTNLPISIYENVLKDQGVVVDINTKENYFSENAIKKRNGYSLIGRSSDILPEFQALFHQYVGVN